MEPPASSSSRDDGRRRDLFRYLTADESGHYLAVMDLFAATLLTDLSAAEVATQLADRGRTLERDTVEARCRQLVEWGNLVPSIRDARVSSLAEYIRSRSRYQVSKLGGRVHREAVEILQATDGAREVARELLGQIVQSLDRIIAQLGRADIDADALAGEVTTVFGNQRLFTDSVRDFYAYLAGILTRYDLGGDEYAQFKELLLHRAADHHPRRYPVASGVRRLPRGDGAATRRSSPRADRSPRGDAVGWATADRHDRDGRRCPRGSDRRPATHRPNRGLTSVEPPARD